MLASSRIQRKQCETIPIFMKNSGTAGLGFESRTKRMPLAKLSAGGTKQRPGCRSWPARSGTPTGVPGDYNGNNIVDAADYTIWRDGDPLLNEGTTPGVIDQEDYNFWKTHFGDVPGGGAAASGTAVPEPGSLVIAAICGGLLVSRFVVRKLFGID